MKCGFSTRRRGAAIVEMAFAIPILLVIMFGVIDFSVYANNTLKLANATREGARAAATGKNIATIKERVTKFAAPLSLSGGDGSIKVEVSSDGGSTYSSLGDTATGTQNAAQPDQYIRVSTTSTNRSTTGALGFIFNRGLEKQVVMRRERTS